MALAIASSSSCRPGGAGRRLRLFAVSAGASSRQHKPPLDAGARTFNPDAFSGTAIRYDVCRVHPGGYGLARPRAVLESRVPTCHCFACHQIHPGDTSYTSCHASQSTPRARYQIVSVVKVSLVMPKVPNYKPVPRLAPLYQGQLMTTHLGPLAQPPQLASPRSAPRQSCRPPSSQSSRRRRPRRQ